MQLVPIEEVCHSVQCKYISAKKAVENFGWDIGTQHGYYNEYPTLLIHPEDVALARNYLQKWMVDGVVMPQYPDDGGQECNERFESMAPTPVQEPLDVEKASVAHISVSVPKMEWLCREQILEYLPKDLEFAIFATTLNAKSRGWSRLYRNLLNSGLFRAYPRRGTDKLMRVG